MHVDNFRVRGQRVTKCTCRIRMIKPIRVLVGRPELLPVVSVTKCTWITPSVHSPRPAI